VAAVSSLVLRMAMEEANPEDAIIGSAPEAVAISELPSLYGEGQDHARKGEQAGPARHNRK